MNLILVIIWNVTIPGGRKSGWWVVGGVATPSPFPNSPSFDSSLMKGASYRRRAVLSLFFFISGRFRDDAIELKVEERFFLRSRVSVGVSLFFFLVAFHLFFSFPAPWHRVGRPTDRGFQGQFQSTLDSEIREAGPLWWALGGRRPLGFSFSFSFFLFGLPFLLLLLDQPPGRLPLVKPNKVPKNQKRAALSGRFLPFFFDEKTKKKTTKKFACRTRLRYAISAKRSIKNRSIVRPLVSSTWVDLMEIDLVLARFT